MSVTVRQATHEDSPEIFGLLVDHFHPEHKFGTRGLPLQPRKVVEHIFDHLVNGIVFIAERDGEIVGSIALKAMAPWWTELSILVDGWYYVRPDARASRAAIMLMDEANKVAEDTGSLLTVVVYNAVDTERKSDFFKRKGFLPMGGIYVRS